MTRPRLAYFALLVGAALALAVFLIAEAAMLGAYLDLLH